MKEQQVEQQEPQEPQEQVQQAVDDAQEDAAMKAAIAEARGDEPPAASEAETQQDGTPETIEAKEVPEEPKAILAGLTEEQIKQLLVKAGEVDDLKAQVRNVFGRFGELNSRIQHLNKVGMSEEDLVKAKGVATQYHEAILDGDMEKANELYLQSMQLMPRQQVQQQPQIDIGSALTEQSQKFEAKLLSMKHPDWQQQRQSADFDLWVQTLPEADRQELGNSWDAAYISNKLDEFKSWRSKSTQSGQQTQKKQQRLVNAVTPQGTAHAVPNPVTEEEAMQAAIRARIRPRMAAT